MNKFFFVVRWVRDPKSDLKYNYLSYLDNHTKLAHWSSFEDAVRFTDREKIIAYISDDNGKRFWPDNGKDPYISIDEIHPLNIQ